MMGVIARTSVSTMRGDCVSAHTANSVRYSSSLWPGQCADDAQPAPPVVAKSMSAQLPGPEAPRARAR